MHAFPISPNSNFLHCRPAHPDFFPNKIRNPRVFTNSKTLISPQKLHFISRSTPDSSEFDSTIVDCSGDDESGISGSSFDPYPESISDDGVDIAIEKIGNNSRRIHSRITIDASLETVWHILTDYEGLADFIPGLTVNKLLEKRENFARLFQVGEQNLAFGLKFSAKGIVDCYEKDLENLPFGQRRDIEFKMIEGDFHTFDGKWSIEQININPSVEQAFSTSLSYVVDVEPKLWLPVGLVEGRLCREIKVNLLSIREVAHKAIHNPLPTC